MAGAAGLPLSPPQTIGGRRVDNLKEKVVIAVSSRALFDLEEEHALFEEKASTPHSPGPLRRLFEQLSAFQRFDYNHRGAADPYFEPAVRISIVTARGAPSEERLITTLKSFGMSAAELFLLDGLDKQPFLKAIRPHIFFDDQANNLKPSLNIVPSVLVPFGIHHLEKLP